MKSKIALSISSICIGLLTGFSISPVIHITIAFLITILIGSNILKPFLTSVATDREYILIAILSVSITIGAFSGMFFRNYLSIHYSSLEKTIESHEKNSKNNVNPKSDWELHSGKGEIYSKLSYAIETQNPGRIRSALYSFDDSLINQFLDHCTDSTMIFSFAKYIEVNE